MTSYVLQKCYIDGMRSISQRELRNDSGEIMRGLARGESYRITSRGVPLGVLRPESGSPLDEALLRRGSQDMRFPTGIVAAERTDEVLRALRGAR